MNNKLLEENIIFLLLPIIVIGLGIYGLVTFGGEFQSLQNDVVTKKEDVSTKKQKLEQIREQKRKQAELAAQEAQKPVEEKKSKSGKVIYEVLGQQFSPEASFGIMFENILANMTGNGVKIRSINYDYAPASDKILEANVSGYNACELSFTTVSTYTQLQRFFKSLAKESYLTSIHEVDIEPYDKDKTILVAKFKIRLYTKLI